MSPSRCKDYQSLTQNIPALTSKNRQYFWVGEKKRVHENIYVNLPRVKDKVESIK